MNAFKRLVRFIHDFYKRIFNVRYEIISFLDNLENNTSLETAYTETFPFTPVLIP